MNPVGAYQKRLGEENRERIAGILRDFLGIRNREISKLTGLDEMTVGRHVKAIKAEWIPTYEAKLEWIKRHGY